MKKILSMLAGITMLAGLSSCSKSSDSETQPQQPVGKPTLVGVVLNKPVSRKNIGPAGGEITSADGRLKLVFPAGAMTEEDQVSIYPITNENPLGTGVGYRLEPHGVQFQKPVQVIFNYSDEDHKHSLPEMLGIAYQDERRIWNAVGGVLDKANKTYTVTTDHFSDWSFFETCKLVASANTVGVNGTVQLKVESAAFLVPLVPGENGEIGDVIDYTPEYVKKWKLSGAGNLTPNKAQAVYKAPATVPNLPNPVAVSVELDFKQKGKFLVVTHISIVDDDGEIEISVGGGAPSRRIASPVVKIAPGIYGFGDADGDELGSWVYITWEGGIGPHSIKDPLEVYGTQVQYQFDNGPTYLCFYFNEYGQMLPSNGGVTITSMGEDDGYVKGTFSLSPVTIGPEMLETTSLSGSFRAKKGFQ